MQTTLYKLNNFNDVTYWTATLTDNTLTLSWGRCSKTSTEPVQHGTQVVEVTPERLVDEYHSRVRHQKERKGFTDTIPSAPPDLPMLAQEYKGNVKFDKVALQPKLDGIRCIMSREGLLSRRNLFFTSCPHIELYLSKLPEGIKLDGELYIPNVPLSTIESYVMRGRPDYSVCKEIEYHVFDIIDTEAPFEVRILEAERIVSELEEVYIRWRTDNKLSFNKLPYFSHKCPFKMVHTVLHDTTPGEDDLHEQFDSYRAAGYEGMMIRNSNAPYEVNKRSPSLLKMKSFVDNEFLIVDVVPGTNKQGVFVCETSSGKEFKCSFRGTHAKRQQILTYKNNYIGKYLKVEFEGYSEYGVPRCPVGIHYFAKEQSDKPVGETTDAE
jgi:DNA ligase-1